MVESLKHTTSTKSKSMLEIHVLREDPEKFIKALNKRGGDYEPLVRSAIELDRRRRELQAETDGILAEINARSKKIGEHMRSGDKSAAERIKTEVADFKDRSRAMKRELAELEVALRDKLYDIPNAPHDTVPAGTTEEENEEVERSERQSVEGDAALPHWELAERHGLIDFPTGVKITGAGFPLYRGKGAKLQRALISFFLDEAERAGYDEVIPPLLINEDSGIGTGQLPDKEGQMYHVTEDDLYLIPTSEVPVTNIYRDEILPAESLPIKHCAYTPCFRREAGSYGKDVRGLNRLHQFDKVEIVQITTPERSHDALKEMIDHVRSLLEKLELPYRLLRLCGGDLGVAAAVTYDFEVYSAAQDKWLEVSSVSNFETYQSNRLKCRYRTEEKRTALTHTLNGSALALPRIVAALMENNQKDGDIRIPTVLQPYTRFKTIAK